MARTPIENAKDAGSLMSKKTIAIGRGFSNEEAGYADRCSARPKKSL